MDLAIGHSENGIFLRGTVAGGSCIPLIFLICRLTSLYSQAAISKFNFDDFRTDLELTVAGLKTCYNNIFNLRRFGIGAVTCNMCAGVIPFTDSQKSICFR